MVHCHEARQDLGLETAFVAEYGVPKEGTYAEEAKERLMKSSWFRNSR